MQIIKVDKKNVLSNLRIWSQSVLFLMVASRLVLPLHPSHSIQ